MLPASFSSIGFVKVCLLPGFATVGLGGAASAVVAADAAGAAAAAARCALAGLSAGAAAFSTGLSVGAGAFSAVASGAFVSSATMNLHEIYSIENEILQA
jgi:hypothetical protein